MKQIELTDKEICILCNSLLLARDLFLNRSYQEDLFMLKHNVNDEQLTDLMHKVNEYLLSMLEPIQLEEIILPIVNNHN